MCGDIIYENDKARARVFEYRKTIARLLPATEVWLWIHMMNHQQVFSVFGSLAFYIILGAACSQRLGHSRGLQ